jgi:RND family efflux transporter MFP subunit
MKNRVIRACVRSAAPTRRVQLVAAAALVAILSLPTSGLKAGPGHDHGPEPASTGSPPSPRAVATSETYQFVGIAEGEVLVIYLDRATDNAPVTTAKLDVTVGEAAAPAELQKNGTYEVSAKLLKTPGEHAVLASIQDGPVNDLLVTSIKIPNPEAHSAASEHTVLSHLGLPEVATLTALQSAALAGGGLLLLIGLATVVRTRARRTALGLAAVGLSLGGVAAIGSTPVVAHEGHDHGPAAGASNGNAPQRRPDGTIFLPKPTQRLLEVRTRIVAPEKASRTVRFQGRIIANPNRSGVIQSTLQGRYSPPASGIPLIGTNVKAGDLVGTVAPSFISKDASDMSQTLAELDQQIALARAKLGRQEQLLRSATVSRAAVEDVRIQLDGLAKRRSEILEARVQPEELRAPVDGVITAIKVMPGQVVSQADQLFQIVDPESLFVEALMYDQSRIEQIGEATASLGDGKSVPLRFVGRSRSLQQQYTVLKYEITGPAVDLNIGTPVLIVGKTGVTVEGLRLPRSAVAQAPNGQNVVFIHKEPEVFEPRAIRFQPFDTDTIMVSAGLEAGEKVVVQNAPLVNQVR